MLLAGLPAQLTDGHQVRDFLDIKEAAQMIVNVAIGKATGPVNICSGVGTTVRQMVEKIADESGRRDLLKFGTRAENQTDPPCVIGIK
jgi:dTDP-6-deoxy-L-talose 4-dehydrogenase (NAD+)